MNFFSFNFPLREYFFCTSPAPRPSPHKFSNGPSLSGRCCSYWTPPWNINVDLCCNNDIILLFVVKNDVWHALSKCMDSHKQETNFLSRWLTLLSIQKRWDANLSGSAVATQSCTRFKYILVYEEGFCGKWYYYYY